ncbi:MAG: hypothetical protein VCE43_17710, partial [Myxococcota bacterium]
MLSQALDRADLVRTERCAAAQDEHALAGLTRHQRNTPFRSLRPRSSMALIWSFTSSTLLS